MNNIHSNTCAKSEQRVCGTRRALSMPFDLFKVTSNKFLVYLLIEMYKKGVQKCMEIKISKQRSAKMCYSIKICNFKRNGSAQF